MNKDYEKAMIVVDSIVKSIPEDIKDKELESLAYVYVKIGNMIDYDDYACKLIESHLAGYDRERAYDCVIEPASDIRCLLRCKAICKGYAEVLNVILNKLNIKTIKVSSGDHEWNQVLINGTWYNCDLTNDSDSTRDYRDCRYFLKSDDDIKRKPITESHECNSSLRLSEQLRLIDQAKRNVKKENQIKTLNEIKEKLKGKISTDDLFVTCKVQRDSHLIEPFIQYESFGKELHRIIIDPKRSLVLKCKYEKDDTYFDVSTLEAVTPLNYSSSYYSTSSASGTIYCGYIDHIFNSGIGSINEEIIRKRKKDMNQCGYLMTFREYIKKKLGINIDEVTLNQANALLKLTNMVRSKKFILSDIPEEAKKQLDKKVYMKRNIKEEN